MLTLSDERFYDLVERAIDAVPPPYRDRLENIAFIVEDVPSAEQAKYLKLRCNDLLFGLYEGVPLPARGGGTKLLPDKITIFKTSLEMISEDEAELYQNIHHTVWHEVAHYFGLDHHKIHQLEKKKPLRG